jgi:hypothetical protein
MTGALLSTPGHLSKSMGLRVIVYLKEAARTYNAVVTCFHHSIHPAKDHLIQAFLHHTDRSLNHLEFALSPFVEDYYASPCRRGSVSYKFIQLSLGSSLPGRNGIPNPLERIAEPEDTIPSEWDEGKSNEK